MSSVQAFISVMDEFLNELQKTFPEEKKIAVYYNSFKTMKKTNPRIILDSFMAEASKRADKITERDESYFLSGEDEFMNEINVKKWWTAELSQTTKDAIWQYINTLFVLGTTITSIPSNLLTTIEGVAEQCASQMEAGGDDVNGLKPENMENLLAGMQSMIGNMMGGVPQTPKKSKKKIKK